MATLSPTVHATSVQPPEFDSLVTQADYVVRGVVKSVTSDWREENGHRFIGTKVEVEVLEVIRGTPPTPLILDIVGGKVGETELVVTGSPRFNVGDEDILFLKAGTRYITPLVGIMHGRYPIIRDAKSGQTYAVRNNGMPIYSEKDVSLPMEKLSTTKTQNTAAKPMTAASFVGKIRSVNGRQPLASDAK
ncbi:hypothetical protein [Oleiharenicola lentus]|uniref:hypothetical protein n=1 Tax=Oleiharenicola lentus TaxID=2508720 RepID=UPI003F67CE08